MKTILGDAMDVLPTFLPLSMDAVITDPPYGTTDGKAKTMGIYSGGVWPEFGHAWDTELPLDWIAMCVPLLKDGGAVIAFTDAQKSGVVWDAMEKAGLRPLRFLYWHKTNPPTNPRKNFCSSVETAVFARKPGKVLSWNGGGASHNYYQCAKVAACHKIHKTQKPVELMRWLMEKVTGPEMTVLDPFMGSGSTGMAALELDRTFIGIEKDPDAYEKGTARLAAAGGKQL
jgi:DNA modification methylase